MKPLRSLTAWSVRSSVTRLALAGSVLVGSWLALPDVASAERVKDIARLEGYEDMRLVGYGIVTGLDGTGDTQAVALTDQTLAGVFEKLGRQVPESALRTRNAALVMVSANFAPFSTPGTSMDIVVSSIGDAKSLRGGSLIPTPLIGYDGLVYAMASGELTVGGYTASGSGSSVTRNHPTVGRVPDGAVITQPLGNELDLGAGPEVVFVLRQADFTTAANTAAAISKSGFPASAVDSRRVKVTVPNETREARINAIAAVESVAVQTDMVAKIVMNGRTGTVIMGSHVRIGQVAIAHGGLEVEVASTTAVSQPGTLGRGNTATVRNAQVTATEKDGAVRLIGPTASLGELVTALNTLGVKPSDLIDILQAMRGAGALAAEIEVQ